MFMPPDFGADTGVEGRGVESLPISIPLGLAAGVIGCDTGAETDAGGEYFADSDSLFMSILLAATGGAAIPRAPATGSDGDGAATACLIGSEPPLVGAGVP